MTVHMPCSALGGRSQFHSSLVTVTTGDNEDKVLRHIDGDGLLGHHHCSVCLTLVSVPFLHFSGLCFSAHTCHVIYMRAGITGSILLPRVIESDV